MRVMMKIKSIVLSSIVLLGVCTNALASEETERVYLIQIVNQLHAAKSLIVAADREQPKHLRMQFHYSHFQDANGQHHNGLMDDINLIESGIREKLEHTPSAPHLIKPISGDYIDHQKRSVTL